MARYPVPPIAEPAVTLTDYALTVECALLAALLWRRDIPRTRLRAWLGALFVFIGLAALLGGTVHGFFPDERSPTGALLWRATLLAIGFTTASAWQAGAGMALSPAAARWVSVGATAQLVAYGAVVIFVSQRFSIAVAGYLPAALFLLGAFAVAYRRTRARAVLPGLAGLALSLLASWIQQAGLALHPTYLDHNTLYHVIEAGALVLLFQGARAVCRLDGGARSSPAPAGTPP